MARRFSSNTAAIAYTTGSLNNTDVASTIALTVPLAGWPASTPFLAALDKGNATEEVVLIIAVSGTNVTATRGYDGTPKRAHGIGATLQHVAAAVDYDEANAHVNASSGVHGVVGSVVGTSDAQTLTNKTLTAPTVGDLTNMQHDHSAVSHGGNIPQASVTGLTSALGALESASAHAADITTVNSTITTNDGLAVHKAGVETITGAKTFSAALTANGGLAVGKNSANTVPVVLNSSGAATTGVYLFGGSVNFTLSSAASTTLNYDLTALGLTGLLSVGLVVQVGAAIRLDCQLDASSTTSLTIRVRQSENVAVTATGTVFVTVLGKI